MMDAVAKASMHAVLERLDDGLRRHVAEQPGVRLRIRLDDAKALRALLIEALGGPVLVRDTDDELLTSAQAAMMLGCSRHHVCTLGDGGSLPVTTTEGGHRRFKRGDVVAYSRKRRGS